VNVPSHPAPLYPSTKSLKAQHTTVPPLLARPINRTHKPTAPLPLLQSGTGSPDAALRRATRTRHDGNGPPLPQPRAGSPKDTTQECAYTRWVWLLCGRSNARVDVTEGSRAHAFSIAMGGWPLLPQPATLGPPPPQRSPENSPPPARSRRHNCPGSPP